MCCKVKSLLVIRFKQKHLVLVFYIISKMVLAGGCCSPMRLHKRREQQHQKKQDMGFSRFTCVLQPTAHARWYRIYHCTVYVLTFMDYYLLPPESWSHIHIVHTGWRIHRVGTNAPLLGKLDWSHPFKSQQRSPSILKSLKKHTGWKLVKLIVNKSVRHVVV